MSQQPYVGKLEDIALPSIVRHLYLNRATGMLDLQFQNNQRRIFFKEGDVLSARSNRMEQKVGQYLLRVKAISKEQLDRALSHSAGPLGHRLVDLGFLPREEVDEHLKDMVREIVFECFGWTSGIFRFSEGPFTLSHDAEIHVSSADIIFNGFKLYGAQGQAETLLKGGKAILTPNPNPKLLFQHITLEPSEGYLLSQINGTATAEEILRILPGEKAKNRTTLAAFVACGLVSPREESAVPTLPDFFAKLTQIRPPTAHEGKKKRLTRWIRTKRPDVKFTEKDITLMRQKILAKFEKVNVLDYYDLLECPLRATQKEIHFAYMNLCSFYHPDLALKKEFSDLKPKLEVIFQHLQEAYNVLVDHEKRVKYDRTIAYRR